LSRSRLPTKKKSKEDGKERRLEFEPAWPFYNDRLGRGPLHIISQRRTSWSMRGFVRRNVRQRVSSCRPDGDAGAADVSRRNSSFRSPRRLFRSRERWHNRCSHGLRSMQRQSVPSRRRVTRICRYQDGRIARDSGAVVIARRNEVVDFVDERIISQRPCRSTARRTRKVTAEHLLARQFRSVPNQGNTCINQPD